MADQYSTQQQSSGRGHRSGAPTSREISGDKDNEFDNKHFLENQGGEPKEDPESVGDENLRSESRDPRFDSPAQSGEGQPGEMPVEQESGVETKEQTQEQNIEQAREYLPKEMEVAPKATKTQSDDDDDQDLGTKMDEKTISTINGLVKMAMFGSQKQAQAIKKARRVFAKNPHALDSFHDQLAAAKVKGASE
jgi:hypothetical protein